MKKGFKIFLTVVIILFTGILFVFSPYFNITEIVINGNARVTIEEIRNKLGIENNINLFLFNETDVSRKIKENLYIDSVTFVKKYPGSLTVNITERHLSGYVQYMDGQFLYIDEYGRVLEVNTFFTEDYPIVSGLEFDVVRLGEILEVEDSSAFTTMVQYARLLNSHQLIKNVSRIDVSDRDNTRIILNNLEFNVGDSRNSDEKIRIIIDILDKLPNAENIKMFVDIPTISGQYVGKILS